MLFVSIAGIRMKIIIYLGKNAQFTDFFEYFWCSCLDVSFLFQLFLKYFFPFPHPLPVFVCHKHTKSVYK